MSVFQRQPTITSHVGRKIKKIIVSLIVSLLELIQWEIITGTVVASRCKVPRPHLCNPSLQRNTTNDLPDSRWIRSAERGTTDD